MAYSFSRVALFACFSFAGPVAAQDRQGAILLSRGVDVAAAVDSQGRLNPVLTDPSNQRALQLRDVGRGRSQSGLMTAEMASSLEERLSQFREQSLGPVTGIVTFMNGKRFLVQEQSGVSIVTPGGGQVGGIPTNGGQSQQTDGVFVDFTPSTNRTSTPLIGEVVAPDCGANSADPETHCALSTIPLFHRDHGLFCSGVVISDTHVLTAAHCLCDNRVDGSLDPNVFTKLGAGANFKAAFFEPDISFLDTGLGSYCANLVAGSLSARNNDLAVLTLLDSLPDNDRSALEDVQDRIAQDSGEDLDLDELGRMRALIGTASETMWTSSELPGNTFATWGFGVGPSNEAGIKRAMNYPFQDLLACDGDQIDGVCLGVQGAVFQDPVHGLCDGDSGGGVFKPADSPIPDGYGDWALMGIISGTSHASDCFGTTGLLLEQQNPRNIVRIDTAEVATWLDQTTGGTLLRSPVRMTFDVLLADN